MYALSINKDQLAALPTVSFPGIITVIETIDDATNAIQQLHQHHVVGFDTETKPSFRKGRTNTVSLIQVSTDTQCFLFRLNHIGLCDSIRNFLEDSTIIKIGLSLKDDFHVLRKLADFAPAGFVDLQEFVKQYEISDCSLQKIYGIIFEERISKSQRLSNWEADNLSKGQQSYASIDAWACLKIYKHLISGKFDPTTSPYRSLIATDQ